MSNETDALVWKALADPTRRLLLDLLRETPQTTGKLCSRLEHLTRYGVMKHLRILSDANLITIRRNGRHRWNHLNAVPLQEIYERWVKQYESHWASSGLKIKNMAENLKGETPMSTSEATRAVQIELEIRIKASPERAWQAITREVNSWWRDDFRAFADSTLVMELQAGGRLYERSTNGAEGIWYTVIAYTPNESIDLAGHLMPRFGGPATTLLNLRLQGDGEETRLLLSDSIFGKLGDSMGKSVSEGWQMLFGEGLKPYLENQSA